MNPHLATERAAFEAAVRQHLMGSPATFKLSHGGSYAMEWVNNMWRGWKLARKVEEGNENGK